MTTVAPTLSTKRLLNIGPRMAPMLPPAAMKPKTRLAEPDRQASTMTLQKTDTMKRLSEVTDTQ